MTPPTNPNPARDLSLETRLSRLLTLGTLLAALFAASGLVIALLQRLDRPVVGEFQGVAEGLSTVRGVLSGLERGDPRAIMQCGVILLIFTPIARVIVTLVAFAAQRDRLYILITLVVLGSLLWGWVMPGLSPRSSG